MKYLRLLILEDNPDDAELIQVTLKRAGMKFDIKVVSDRQSFTEAIDSFVPEFILSDHQLPQFISAEALEISRKKLPGVPFILVTGTVSEEFAVEIIKAGADDYILKDRMSRLPLAMETALQNRKAQKEIIDYRYALDESAIVAITDQRGIIQYANDNFCKISKYTASELIGQDHRIINSGYHPASYIKDLWVRIANGKIWRGEFCNRAKDGKLYWVDTTIIPFLDTNGKPYQYLSIRIDITERKIMQEQLIERERQLDLFIKHSPAALAMLDTDMRYIAVSERWLDDYKLEDRNLSGKSHYDIFPGMPQRWKDIHRHCLAGNMEKHEEDFIINPDGSINWLRWEIYPWRRASGEIGGIIIFSEDITNRKEAELHIKESEEKYRTLFFKSPLPKWMYDHETLRFLDVNDAAIALYGYSREEFLSMTLKDIRPEEELPLLLEDVKKVTSGADSRRGQWLHRKKNGELIVVETLAHALDVENRRTRMVIAIDITEKLKKEQEILQSRMRLQQAQEIAHLGNWELDFKTNIPKWSDEAYRIFGLTPGTELTADAWISFVHPDDAELANRRFEMSMKQQQDLAMEMRVLRRDGSVRYVYTETKYEFDKKGNPSGVYGIVHDITRNKENENEIRKSEMLLREAQAIAHISNWEIDLDGNLVTWSDEFFRILGLNKDEDIPSEALFLSCIHPDDRAYAQQQIATAFTGFTDSSFEFRFIRTDGLHCYGQVQWKFEFDEKQKPSRLFGILQDITERKEAEMKVRAMEEQIMMQKIQEQQEIARAIITGQEKERNYIGKELHDNINQILAGTKLFLSIGAKKNDEVKELVSYPMELIDTSINEIRLLSHRLVAPLKNIDLEFQVKELLQPLRLGQQIKTTFKYSMAEGVITDDLKLNVFRILQEQVSNIIKYAEAKNVSVILTAADGYLDIVITDDGIGFDTKARREGIGISNIINRAASFNGKVQIKSSPGKGCKLMVSIPY